MEHYNEYHHYLMIAKITDTITAVEEQTFAKLIRDDPQFLDTFEEVRGRFPKEDVESSLARIKQPESWKDISVDLIRHKTTTTRVLVLKLLAAAMLSGLIITGFWYWNNFKEKPLAALPKQEQQITLQLGDGNVIDLSKNKGNIFAPSIQLSNEDNTLSYSQPNTSASGINRLVIPPGMDYKIILSDGTKVWLNSATELKFPFRFDSKQREVEINGEAYLEVAKNSKQPFIVRLPGCSVQVLGTEFNVNSYEKEAVKVSLVDGSVKMHTQASSAILEPGLEGVLKNATIIRANFNERQRLSWRHGIFHFQQSSLKEIAPVLERWFNVKVVIDNQHILSRRFTGMVDKKQSIEVFKNDIKTISGISSYFDSKGILHFK